MAVTATVEAASTAERQHHQRDHHDESHWKLRQPRHPNRSSRSPWASGQSRLACGSTQSNAGSTNSSGSTTNTIIMKDRRQHSPQQAFPPRLKTTSLISSKTPSSPATTLRHNHLHPTLHTTHRTLHIPHCNHHTHTDKENTRVEAHVAHGHLVSLDLRVGRHRAKRVSTNSSCSTTTTPIMNDTAAVEAVDQRRRRQQSR